MKKNMGNTDRLIRVIMVIIIGIAAWQGIIEGLLAYILLTVAAVFLLTSFISFCPLYSIFGINSCRTKV